MRALVFLAAIACAGGSSTDDSAAQPTAGSATTGTPTEQTSCDFSEIAGTWEGFYQERTDTLVRLELEAAADLDQLIGLNTVYVDPDPEPRCVFDLLCDKDQDDYWRVFNQKVDVDDLTCFNDWYIFSLDGDELSFWSSVERKVDDTTQVSVLTRVP